MLRTAVIVVVAILSLHTASADPEPVQPVHAKNQWVASALALAGSVAPLALVSIGANQSSRVGDDLALAGGAMLVVTPSAGHWYAGETMTAGMRIRLIGAAALGLSLYVANEQHGGAITLGGVAAIFGAIGGGTAMIVGAAYDVSDAGDAAIRWNRAHASVDVMPAPMVLPTPSGAAYGAGFVGRF